jgi:hypothetical protein
MVRRRELVEFRSHLGLEDGIEKVSVKPCLNPLCWSVIAQTWTL